MALPLLYVTAALIGGLVPANPDWHQAGSGITIFVRTNGVHTWIMVPKVAAGIDWRPLAPAAHIRDPRYDGNYLAIGYGNREFYLNTPAWGDLSPRTALAAVFGRGPGLVHVEHEWNPQADEYQRPLILTAPEYRRLAAHIRASFDLDSQGRSKPLLGRGYGPADVFYEAQGRYDAYRTCNEWTGEALRSAGVRTGIWTPFSESIMLRLGGGSALKSERKAKDLSLKIGVFKKLQMAGIESLDASESPTYMAVTGEERPWSASLFSQANLGARASGGEFSAL